MTEIIIVAGGKSFTYRDEPIAPSDFTVEEQIRDRRINAPLGEKLELVDKYLSKGADYQTALGVCFPLLDRTVELAARHVYVQAVDADVEYKNKTFKVVPHKNGAEIDKNKLYAGIYYNLKYSGGGRITAHVRSVTPAVTTELIRSELFMRGEYATEYYSSTAARAHNVSLALEKFDGISIAPGESASFNRTVGPRTEENGFKKAKIIVDGKYTDGVGGGVCQASTALYNAALLAGLTCNANAHSICPSYCPPGLDAMISSVSDLVITNNTDRTVRISACVEGKKATVKIYGQQNEYTVVPESVVIKCIRHEQIEQSDTERKYFDADAVSGDRQLVALGKDGYISETYLKYYKNGELIKRVKIRTNEYIPTPQIIAVAP